MLEERQARVLTVTNVASVARQNARTARHFPGTAVCFSNDECVTDWPHLAQRPPRTASAGMSERKQGDSDGKRATLPARKSRWEVDDSLTVLVPESPEVAAYVPPRQVPRRKASESRWARSQ